MNTTYSVVKRLVGQASTSGKQGGFRKLLARISRFVLELLIFMAGKYISKLEKKHRNHFSLKRMALGPEREGLHKAMSQLGLEDNAGVGV